MRLRLVSPVLMWFIVIAGAVPLLLLLPERPFFSRNPVIIIVFAITIANWAYFLLGSASVHRQAPASAAAIRRLVTDGVYSKVRHPIYSADIILGWGIFVFWPTLGVLLSAAWLTIVLVTWMKLEEYALLEKFGEEYASYMKKTPMMIPDYFSK